MILRNLKQSAPHLLRGDIGVIPTDTLYGVVARAQDPHAVERVYQIRGRSPEKACIILVAGVHQINDTAAWTAQHFELANNYWPGPLSLLTPITAKTPHYLHRGTGALVYRVPDVKGLRELLEKTGPLIAPSANKEGKPPATTLAEAQGYFGEGVDFYVDGGSYHNTTPSTIVAIEQGRLKVLRQGAAHVV